MIRLRRVGATIILISFGCHSGPVSGGALNACGAPEIDTSFWRELASYVNGVEMRHPASYVHKNWMDASSPELLKTVELWRDDKPANNVRFAKAPESTLMFQVQHDEPVTTCTIPVESGVWRVWLQTAFSSDKGANRRPQYVVRARLPILGDTSLIQFMGIAQDSAERITQINMLRTFRLMGRSPKE